MAAILKLAQQIQRWWNAFAESVRSRPRGYALALAVLAVLTAVMFAFRSHLDALDVLLLYLMAVFATAISVGAGPAIVVALLVLPSEGEAGLNQQHGAECRKARELAEDLGARIRAEQGQDIAEVFARVVNQENANLLVMGYAPVRGVRKLVIRGLVDRVLDLVTNVDVYLVEKPRR
jgi:K+-sensing histidine kinase KdpD